MKEFISDLYEEQGVWRFLMVALIVIMIVFLIIVLSLQGTDDCFHSWQSNDYCSYCGEALQEYCSACGKAVENVPFCGYCGHSLN